MQLAMLEMQKEAKVVMILRGVVIDAGVQDMIYKTMRSYFPPEMFKSKAQSEVPFYIFWNKT